MHGIQKLKYGGILAGHDYIQREAKARGVYFGVYTAVNKFIKKYKLSVDHATLESTQNKNGEQSPSYFIINYPQSSFLHKILGKYIIINIRKIELLTILKIQELLNNLFYRVRYILAKIYHCFID